MAEKCKECGVIMSLGCDEAEAEAKRVSHNEWYHPTPLHNIERSRDIFCQAVKLLEQLIEEDYIGAYDSASKITTLSMKIERYCDDKMSGGHNGEG
jgi:hypothetical protein